MKGLVEYINEKKCCGGSKCENCKEFTFDFTGVDNASELMKSLKEFDCVDVDKKNTNKFTLSVCKDCTDCMKSVESVQDILQQTLDMEQAGVRTTNDEQYAQKVRKLVNTMTEMNDYLDELAAAEEEPESDPAEEDDDKKSKKDKKEAE